MHARIFGRSSEYTFDLNNRKAVYVSIMNIMLDLQMTNDRHKAGTVDFNTEFL